MNEILTLDYPKPYLGNYINRWFLVQPGTGRIKRFKTEAGALRMYEKIPFNVMLLRETDCVGVDMLILTK